MLAPSAKGCQSASGLRHPQFLRAAALRIAGDGVAAPGSAHCADRRGAPQLSLARPRTDRAATGSVRDAPATRSTAAPRTWVSPNRHAKAPAASGSRRAAPVDRAPEPEAGRPLTGSDLSVRLW